jgi:hypothetical protein
LEDDVKELQEDSDKDWDSINKEGDALQKREAALDEEKKALDKRSAAIDAELLTIAELYQTPNSGKKFAEIHVRIDKLEPEYDGWAEASDEWRKRYNEYFDRFIARGGNTLTDRRGSPNMLEREDNLPELPEKLAGLKAGIEAYAAWQKDSIDLRGDIEALVRLMILQEAHQKLVEHITAKRHLIGASELP